MRRASFFIAISVFILFLSSVSAADSTIRGDYLEVRTSDVYTGPCFANGEVNLTGKEAIAAWRIEAGAFQGVALDGLTVVAVIKSETTLGDPYAQGGSRAVLVVDERADSKQQEALVAFAQKMTGSLLNDVVDVLSAPVTVEIGENQGFARLEAGQFARFETRALNEHDHLCGNEIVYYPPLSDASVIPAFTKVHEFSGPGLNGTWSSPYKRSAFIGRFER